MVQGSNAEAAGMTAVSHSKAADGGINTSFCSLVSLVGKQRDFNLQGDTRQVQCAVTLPHSEDLNSAGITPFARVTLAVPPSGDNKTREFADPSLPIHKPLKLAPCIHPRGGKPEDVDMSPPNEQPAERARDTGGAGIQKELAVIRRAPTTYRHRTAKVTVSARSKASRKTREGNQAATTGDGSICADATTMSSLKGLLQSVIDGLVSDSDSQAEITAPMTAELLQEPEVVLQTPPVAPLNIHSRENVDGLSKGHPISHPTIFSGAAILTALGNAKMDPRCCEVMNEKQKPPPLPPSKQQQQQQQQQKSDCTGVNWSMPNGWQPQHVHPYPSDYTCWERHPEGQCCESNRYRPRKEYGSWQCGGPRQGGQSCRQSCAHPFLSYNQTQNHCDPRICSHKSQGQCVSEIRQCHCHGCNNEQNVPMQPYYANNW